MLYHVAEDDFQSLRRRRALKSFGQFGSHSRILLHGYNTLGFFEDLGSQVTGSGTDFEDYVGLFDVCLVHNRLRYTGVLEDMLTNVCVHLENVVGGSRGTGGLFARGGSGIRVAFGNAIAILACGLGHLEGRCEG